MSFFSEERSSELKDLFFESAAELLQSLNEDGMELEKRPGDEEVVRQVRRTVHTLKGDSAACGYTELSSLAHELEDALTPELAKRRGKRVAEVVLGAADVFQDMLVAYRGNTRPHGSEHLMAEIRSLTNATNEAPVAMAAPTNISPTAKIEWSEYEQAVLEDAVKRGLKVLQLTLSLDPMCHVREVALQMAKNALQELGNLLVIIPEDGASMANVQSIRAALASSFDEEYIARKCRIPAVISGVEVERFEAKPEVISEAKTKDKARKQPIAQEIILASAEQSDPAQEGNITANLASASETTLRVDAEKVDAVLNLVGELIIGKSMLTQTISEFGKKYGKDPLHAKFADALAFQARVLGDLQKSVMKVRMVPVEQLFRRFGRMVRDVSKTCCKEVVLQLEGQSTDLDKSILDTLAEPMAHLVRNAIDHGIESPEERSAAGKPRQGTVKLDAYHQGNDVVIEISDDGRGIDRQRVVSKAIERGIITAQDAGRLTDSECLDLIFHAGLSTAEEVTSVSGRGVGMDIVKNVLERLKGTVSIKTAVGEGSTFYLKVPLTLAIIKALMFRVGNLQYAVPLGSVVEIVRSHDTEIHRVDRSEVIRLRNEVLTLIRLVSLAKTQSDKPKKMFVVVIAIGERKFGLVVDKLVGEEELVIKALDDHLVATDLVSGASILGDGTVVLILNVKSVVARLGKNSLGATA